VSFTLSTESGESGPVQWLIENRILQFNYNLLFGRGEAGKSSLTSNIIGDWNNNPEMKGERKLKRILWLSEEEGLTGKVKPRFAQYGISEDRVVTLNYHTGDCPRPILPQDQEKFVALLKDNNINCVVLDPWIELLHGDWNLFQENQVRLYVNGLNRVCLLARATIFGIGHVRKAQGGHSSDDMLGCRKVIDACRCVNRVDKTEEMIPRHFFTVQKCNDADPTKPMQFAFGPKANGFSKVEWKGEFDGTIGDIKTRSESKVKRSKLEDAKKMLMETLADGPKTAQEIAAEIKNNLMCPRTVDEAKVQMGVLSVRKVDTATGKGYWVWEMPAHVPPESSLTEGVTMPQLTLEDLPEATNMQAVNLPDAGFPVKKTRRQAKSEKPRAKPEIRLCMHMIDLKNGEYEPCGEPRTREDYCDGHWHMHNDAKPAKKRKPKGKGRGAGE